MAEMLRGAVGFPCRKISVPMYRRTGDGWSSVECRRAHSLASGVSVTKVDPVKVGCSPRYTQLVPKWPFAGHRAEAEFSNARTRYSLWYVLVRCGVSWIAPLLLGPEMRDVFSEGSSPEETTKFIDKALLGNEILVKAWQEYSTWRASAVLQKKAFEWLQLFILCMGIAATFFAVFMSFLLIQWESIVPAQQVPMLDWLVATWTCIQWTVIVLPIAISLLQVPCQS